MLYLNHFFRASLLVVGTLVTLSATSIPTDPDCDNVRVSAEVDQLRNGEKRITLSVRGAQRPVLYVFQDEKGRILTREYKSNTFQTASKGKIKYLVYDGNGCNINGELNLDTDE